MLVMHVQAMQFGRRQLHAQEPIVIASTTQTPPGHGDMCETQWSEHAAAVSRHRSCVNRVIDDGVNVCMFAYWCENRGVLSVVIPVPHEIAVSGQRSQHDTTMNFKL